MLCGRDIKPGTNKAMINHLADHLGWAAGGAAGFLDIPIYPALQKAIKVVDPVNFFRLGEKAAGALKRKFGDGL